MVSNKKSKQVLLIPVPVIEVCAEPEASHSLSMREMFMAQDDLSIDIVYKIILGTTKIISGMHSHDFIVGPLDMGHIKFQQGQQVNDVECFAFYFAY